MGVDATFTLKRPKAHYRSNGELKLTAPTLCALRPDLDKLARAVGDALTQSAVVRDDSLIVRWQLEKVYGEQPGVQVVLHQLSAHDPSHLPGSGDAHQGYGQTI